jgi:signal transduction histidine kinase
MNPAPVTSTSKVFTHIWDGWTSVWHGSFFVFVTVSSLIALFAGESTWARRAVILILALMLCLWYWGMIMRHPEGQQKTRPILIYMAGAIVLSILLVGLHTVFFMVAFSLWPHATRYLPLRWAIPVVAIYATLLAGQWIIELNLSFVPALASIAILAVSTIGWLMLVLWIDSIIHQSWQRQELIEALETTRRELATAERQAGVLEERQRLAREIHDTLAQGFTSIVMHLEAAEQALPARASTTQQHLNQARQTARESLAEARRMIWAIRPELLEQASLPNALTHVVACWKEESSIPTTTTITGMPHPLAPELEVTLLRAAQEALANARKHAQAKLVTVTLSYMNNLVALDVHDDGNGFDTASADLQFYASLQGGFGLQAMRERVQQLGGSFLIESAPGEGTTLVVELPVTGDTE